MNTRFVHFRSSIDGAAVSVAYEISGDRDSLKRTVVYGAAFCSPKDQFSKKFGRKVAENRLNCDRTCRTFEIELDSPHAVTVQVLCALRNEILNLKKKPTWLKSVFNVWYPSFGQKDKFTTTELQKFGLFFNDTSSCSVEDCSPCEEVVETSVEVLDNA